jgi:hypothetical protein
MNRWEMTVKGRAMGYLKCAISGDIDEQFDRQRKDQNERDDAYESERELQQSAGSESHQPPQHEGMGEVGEVPSNSV